MTEEETKATEEEAEETSEESEEEEKEEESSEEAEEENIGIPFPQRTVWMRDEGKVKTLSPSDAKFKAHNKNFYSDSGHEYKPPVEEKKEEPKKKKSMGDKFLSRFKKNED